MFHSTQKENAQKEEVQRQFYRSFLCKPWQQEQQLGSDIFTNKLFH